MRKRRWVAPGRDVVLLIIALTAVITSGLPFGAGTPFSSVALAQAGFEPAQASPAAPRSSTQAAQPTEGAGAAGRGITAFGTFELGEARAASADRNAVLIAGFASTAGGDPDVLALRWVSTSEGFFAQWVLRLESAQGLLDTAGQGRTSVDLARVTPAAGRPYTWTLSYDQDAGILSYVVRSEATSQDVASGTVVVGRADGPFFPVSPGAVTTVTPYYTPVAARFAVGTVSAIGFTQATRIEPDAGAWARLTVPSPAPSGDFRIWIQQGDGEATVLPVAVAGEETLVRLPYLRPGLATVGVDYIQDGEVRLRLERPVTVGTVSATFQRVHRAGVDGPLTGAVTLQSASRIEGLSVQVWADVAPLLWDPQLKDYRIGETRVRRQVFEGIVDLAAGVPLPIGLRFPQPEEEGTWQITFRLELVPDILGYVTTPQWTVATYRPARIEPGEPYTVAVFPDTQIYALHYPVIMFRQAEWLAANAAERNIAFALHVGDITNNNNALQWEVATRALKLLNHTVPYVLALGNHDYVPPEGTGLNSRADTLIQRYFSPADFPHMAGTFPEGQLDNAYHLFEVGDHRYLVVSLEYAPSDAAIAWANEVIAAHPDRTVIVLTHQYLRRDGSLIPSGTTAGDYPVLAADPTTSINDGVAIWNKLVRNHANIEFVISGHRRTATIPHRVTVGDAGNRIYQFLIDYQGEPDGGQGYLVFFEFYPDGTVEVYAYSPYLDSLKPDVDEFGFTNRLRIDRNTGLVTRLTVD